MLTCIAFLVMSIIVVNITARIQEMILILGNFNLNCALIRFNNKSCQLYILNIYICYISKIIKVNCYKYKLPWSDSIY